MSGEFLQPIANKTLRKSVTNAIRQAILMGDLLPGEQINQVQIAEKLGTSRGPVREALRQLEEEGLVENVPYRGNFVIQITPEYIEELYSIRQVLEVFAIELAVQRASEEDLDELRATISEMRHAVTTKDLDLTRELDLRFHRLIYRSSHNSLLLVIWKSLEAGVRLCLAHGHRVYEDPQDIIGTHPDILAAIEAKDVDRASKLMEAHIREAGEAIYSSWVASNKLGSSNQTE